MRAHVIRIGCLAALLVPVAAATSACEPGGRSLDESTEPVDIEAGRQLFQTTCRTCHSLADARAAGTFGPDLDLLQPDAERVREQIDEGGGGMPADLLDGQDADLVARYVAEVAGKGLERNPDLGARGGTRPQDDAAPASPGA